MKAMLLSAGLGTRLKPFTDQHPKALALVNGKTLLQRNIEYLALFGVKDVIVNVHHFADQIIDQINNNRGFGANVTISDEQDEVLETGGGLKKASWFFDDGQPFILMNVDILTDMDIHKMLQFHNANSALATLAITNRSTSRYFLFNESNQLTGWRNVSTGEEKISRDAEYHFPKAFSGVHIIDPKLPTLMQQSGKFSMVDVYLQLASTENIFGFDHSETKFIDVGKPESIVRAEELFPD